MKKLLLLSGLLISTGCGVGKAIDSVNATPGKMDAMNEKMSQMQMEMSKTNESIRLQKVAIAKENLEDPRNAKILLPIPVGLMGYAKLFAENATLEEITGQIYLYLKEINDGVILKSVDASGNEKEFSPQEVNEINQMKLHKFSAAQSICGFLPQSVVDQLVKEYIYTEDRYQKTALNILMMRYQFLRDVMLNASLLSETIDDVGSLEKAYEYINNMDWIARLPFIEKIQVKATGFLPPYPAVNETVSAASAKKSLVSLYKTVLLRAKHVEKIQQYALTGNNDKDLSLYKEHRERLEAVLQATQANLSYWQELALK